MQTDIDTVCSVKASTKPIPNSLSSTWPGSCFSSALWFYCVSNSFLTNFRGIYFSRKVFISFKIMLPEVNLKNLMSTSSRSVVWAPLLNFMYFFLIFFDWSLWAYQFSISKTSKLKTNKSMAYKSMANSTPTLCWDEDNHLNFIFFFSVKLTQWCWPHKAFLIVEKYQWFFLWDFPWMIPNDHDRGCCLFSFN